MSKIDKEFFEDFYKFDEKEDKIKFDVELIPSERDTLLHSIYGQEIFLRWE
jgi:hypothetical protein